MTLNAAAATMGNDGAYRQVAGIVKLACQQYFAEAPDRGQGRAQFVRGCGQKFCFEAV